MTAGQASFVFRRVRDTLFNSTGKDADKYGSRNVVVVGGQTNPYYQAAKMSYSRNVSIGKGM